VPPASGMMVAALTSESLLCCGAVPPASGMMVAALTSETWVSYHNTARHQNCNFYYLVFILLLFLYKMSIKDGV